MFASGVGIAKLLVVSMVGAGLPFGLPPDKEDPVIARVAPEECLFYLSWSGSAAPDAASQNRLEQLLADPEIQFLMTELTGHIDKAVDKLGADKGPIVGMAAKEGLKWGKKLLTRPAALYLSKVQFGPSGLNVDAGMIVNVGADAAELQALLHKVRAEVLGEAMAEVDVGGSKMYRMKLDPSAPSVTIGIKGNYFYAGAGDDSIKGLLDRAATDPPKWLTDVRTQLAVDRPSMTSYINAKSIIAMVGPMLLGGPVPQEMLDAAGVGNITTIASVAGLDKSGYVTRSLIGLDGDAKGVLSFANGKPLSAEDLNVVPHDALLAMVAKVNALKLYDSTLDSLGKIHPALGAVREQIGGLEEMLGFRIRDDVLGSLGDVWCAYHSPGEGGMIAGYALAVEVKDRDRLNGVIKKLMALAKSAGGDGGARVDVEPEDEPPRRQSRLQAMFDRRAPKYSQFKFAGHDIYHVTMPGAGMPISLSWCVTEKHLVVAPLPQSIKAFLARDAKYKSIAARPNVAALLKGESPPSMLMYQDTPTLFDQIYPFAVIFGQMGLKQLSQAGIDINPAIFPSGRSIRRHLKPDVIAMIKRKEGIEVSSRECLPGSSNAITLAAGASLVVGVAFQSGMGDGLASVFMPARANELESKNNLKMMSLAMHNIFDTYRKLPAAYSVNADGKPLLSWRVHILPFLDHIELYEQFHLNEPWDSEHNRKLIAKMPKVFHAPGSKAPPGMTTYLAVGGMRGSFGPPPENAVNTRQAGKWHGATFAQFTDGMSNTIWIVEANDKMAVEWTKPVEFKPDDMNPLNGIVGLRQGGFLGGLADGSVNKFTDRIDKGSLNALFTRHGGERVEPGQFITGRRRSRTTSVEAVVEEATPDSPPIEKVPPKRKVDPFKGPDPFKKPEPSPN